MDKCPKMNGMWHLNFSLKCFQKIKNNQKIQAMISKIAFSDYAFFILFILFDIMDEENLCDTDLYADEIGFNLQVGTIVPRFQLNFTAKF
jgi:hypothetical protein